MKKLKEDWNNMTPEEKRAAVRETLENIERMLNRLDIEQLRRVYFFLLGFAR